MSIERHHDYVFLLGNVAAGQVLNPLQLPTDTDAPFVLRGIGGYSITGLGTSEETTAALPSMLLFRYADADSNWLQTGRTPGMLNMPTPADYIPLRKHMTYPARAVVQMQFENATATPLVNAVVIFRGVKLFPGDRLTAPVYAPTYPECYSPVTYQYATTFNLAAGSAPQLNLPVNVNDDADFAWRATELDADPATANSQVTCLEARIRDPLGKAYASYGMGQAAWLRAQYLFGVSANRPGLWYPEIYIGRGQSIFYDLQNTNTANPATGQFSMDGSKIFSRQLGGR